MKTNHYTTFSKASAMLLSVFFLGFIVLFSSCEKENGGGAAFALKDNPTNLTVSAQGRSETFTVQTTGAWKVDPLRTERWLKITPREGTGEGTFTVTVDRNSTLETRSAVLTFVVDGRVQNHVVRVEQEAGTSADEEDNTPYLNFDSMSSLELPEEGVNGRYTVRATGDWRIEILEGEEWLSISPLEGRYDEGVNLSAAVNTDISPRTGRLAFYLDGERVPGTFEINQEGMEVIMFEEFDWLVYGSPIFNVVDNETRIDNISAEDKARGWTFYKKGSDNVASTYARTGFWKLGKTNFGADLYSPPLAAVEGTKNLQVTFKAANYMTAGGSIDHNLLTVGVTGPGTVSQSIFYVNNPPDYANDPNCIAVWNKPEALHTFTITGATAETRIWFLAGSYTDFRVPGGNGLPKNVNRIFLDDILVAVKKR